MTFIEALKLVNIDFSKAIKDETEYEDGIDKTEIFLGSYQNEQIGVYDEGDVFVVSLGIGRKNYRVHKATGKVEEFQILVC